MSRNRDWIVVVALALMLSGLLIACQPAQAPPTQAAATPVPAKATEPPAATELVVQTWGGAVQEAENAAFYEPFEKETGIKVVQVVGSDVPAKLKVMVESGKVEWDVISGMGLMQMIRLGKDGLLEPVDYSLVTNTDSLIPGGKQDIGVAMEIYGDVLAYDTEVFKDNPPTSAADFFDLQKYPGNRCVNNWGSPEIPFYFALLGDGVPRDQIWSTLQTEEGRNRALKKLDSVKSVLRTYDSGDQMMRLFLDKEVTMGIVLDGRMNKVNSQGGNVKLIWDGGYADPAYWGVVKNAPHKEAAMKFLNYILDADRQAVYTQHIFYGTSNTEAAAKLPEELRKGASTYPENLAKLHVLTAEDSAVIAEIQPTLLELWNAWVSK